MESEKSNNLLNLFHELSKETIISSNKALSSSTNQNTSSNKSLFEQEDSVIPKLVPVEFTWKGECDLVYITGSFCNWKQKFIMQQTAKGLFTLSLKLQEGVHQYKFIIDNDWQYSPYHSKIKENGITNNVIEVKDDQTIEKQPIIKRQEPNNNKRDGYDTILDVCIVTPAAKCNELYNQNIDMTNRKITMNSKDYAKTDTISHIHLNHLLINKQSNSNKNIIKAGYIRRIRSKFVTIIYISRS